MDVIIIRPGLVYSDYDRGWTVPLALASTIGNKICNNQPKATNLSTLTDLVIKKTRGSLDKSQKQDGRIFEVISANQI
jgi:hypothetical protein